LKSIFLGDVNQINRVYPENIKKALSVEAGIDDSVMSKTDIKANRDSLAETRFIFSTWGMPAMETEEIKEYFPGLEAVFYAAGSVQGFARSFLDCGIKVFSAWAANGVPVAEYALAQILLANKNFYACARYAKAGDRSSATGHICGNYGCKVGIIGAGMIGKLVIGFLHRHCVDILVFDPFLSDEQASLLGVEKCSLKRLFEECQTVSNHLANNAQTVGMLDYGLFSSMLPNAVFINTGRGAQVEETGLCRALAERPDLTAVLDVTYPEPPEAGHDFYSLPNVVLTPHIAGSVGREVERMALYMLEEYRRFTSGVPCLYEVTVDMLATMA
jgi:phosphoglycerate dehydrogenase-like enzyme